MAADTFWQEPLIGTQGESVGAKPKSPCLRSDTRLTTSQPGPHVVVLGETGINFAAGMSGGIAYVYDPERRFDGRCNLEMVDLELVQDEEDITELKEMIREHHENTGSKRASHILSEWDACLPFFVKVFPMEYRRVLGQMSKEDEATERAEVQHG